MNLAQEAYQAYANHTGWKSLATGQPLPQWDALPEAIQKAWQVSAAWVVGKATGQHDWKPTGDAVPIPVHVARMIGLDYSRDMVVILAYHRNSEVTTTVTWGRESADKEGAANVAQRCAELIGCDASTYKPHQDYRFISEGERAAIIDGLVKACQAADHAIASVITFRGGITDECLEDVRCALKAACEKA